MKEIFWDICLFLAIMFLVVITLTPAHAKGPPSVWITTVHYEPALRLEPYYPPGYFQAWRVIDAKPREGYCDLRISRLYSAFIS